MNVSPEQSKQYRKAAYTRWQAEQQRHERRRAAAWTLARQAGTRSSAYRSLKQLVGGTME
jgi:hypothetical protein